MTATPPRPETVTRLTDIVVDSAQARLGTTGTNLADDFVSRVNQALGIPIEITPQASADSTVNVGTASYTLPSGIRVGIYDGSSLLTLAAGVISFTAGTISTGSNATFSLPNLAAGQYVRALIAFRKDLLALAVTFGSPNSSIASSGMPTPGDGYSPVAILELHSTLGGPGAFDAIAASNIVYILNSLQSRGSPKLEQQTVTGSAQSLFTLATISIPENRLKLRVSVNGVRQFYPEDFGIPTDNQVSFTNAQPVNAEVSFEISN